MFFAWKATPFLLLCISCFFFWCYHTIQLLMLGGKARLAAGYGCYLLLPIAIVLITDRVLAWKYGIKKLK